MAPENMQISITVLEREKGGTNHNFWSFPAAQPPPFYIRQSGQVFNTFWDREVAQAPAGC